MDWKVGLNFYSEKGVLFDPVSLGNEHLSEVLQNAKCHVYILAKRKKIYFDELLNNEDGSQTIKAYTLSEKHEQIPLSVAVPSTLLIHGYENGFFHIDEGENKDLHFRDFGLYNYLYRLIKDPIGESVKEPIPTDFEVMYIGQAYGRKVDRTIDYRLTNHEKVQKIALEILSKGSNEELLVFGITVGSNDMTTGMSVRDTENTFSREKMLELFNTARQRITEGQTITVFEASLIKYFKPDLNKEYKETFPSQDFKSYDEIYQTSFNYISLTLDGLTVYARLFSKAVPERKYIHTSIHSLATNEEKKSLFDYLMKGED
jgi:hypothetical protein